MKLPYNTDVSSNFFLNDDKTGFLEVPLDNTAKFFEPYAERLQRFNDEVLATGSAAPGISPLSPGRSQDKVISQFNKKENLRQFLSSVGDIAIRSDANGMTHLRYRNGNDYFDYVVVADDRWVNVGSCTQFGAGFTGNGEYGLEELLSLPLDRIKEIEIVKAPAPPLAMKNFGNIVINDPENYGVNESLSPLTFLSSKQITDLSHPGYMGTILITTVDRKAGINDAVSIDPLGYQASRDFYSPVYETKEQQEAPTPDLRTTIYWNPDVQTDADGKAKISFYTSDIPASYTITIEGVTKDGALFHKTIHF
jgi:hypothetical protein